MVPISTATRTCVFILPLMLPVPSRARSPYYLISHLYRFYLIVLIILTVFLMSDCSCVLIRTIPFDGAREHSRDFSIDKGKLHIQHAENSFVLQVCRAAWMFIHSVSEQRLSDIQSEIANDKNPFERNSPPNYNCLPRRAAIAWLAEYFAEENGRTEKIPNPQSDRDEWHLPAWMSKQTVYRIYVADPSVSDGE